MNSPRKMGAERILSHTQSPTKYPISYPEASITNHHDDKAIID